MVNLPISVLPEWKSPCVNMKIEGESLPVLLDTGTEISGNNGRTLLPECRSLTTCFMC